MPKNSTWAKHKFKVVSQAIKLLTIAAKERTAQQAAELNRLLGTLKLTETTPAAAAAGDAAAAPAPGPAAAAAANGAEDEAAAAAMQE